MAFAAFDDPSGEVLKQLTRIADAVNKALPSPWLDWAKTIVAFLLGLATAYITQLIQGRFRDRKEKGKMRRIVYSELAQSFLYMHQMAIEAASSGNSQTPDLRLLQAPCTFEGETYLKQNSNVFYQLPEGMTLTWLYSHFHTVQAGSTYALPLFQSPLRFFSQSFKTERILRKYFRQFAGREKFRLMRKAVQHYNDTPALEDSIGITSPGPSAGTGDAEYDALGRPGGPADWFG